MTHDFYAKVTNFIARSLNFVPEARKKRKLWTKELDSEWRRDIKERLENLPEKYKEKEVWLDLDRKQQFSTKNKLL